MRNAILILFVFVSSFAMGFWGEDNPSLEALNFMKDTQYDLYGCIVVTEGMKPKNEPSKLNEFHKRTMAKNIDEAKVKMFDRISVGLGKKSGKLVFRFKTSGDVLEEIRCHKIKDLID